MPDVAAERLSAHQDIAAESPNPLTFTIPTVVNGLETGDVTVTAHALHLGQKRTQIAGETPAQAKTRIHLMVSGLQSDGTTLLQLTAGCYVTLNGKEHEIEDPGPFIIAPGAGGVDDVIYYDAMVELG